jgi:hypothetical protein
MRAKPHATWSGVVEGGTAHQFANLVGFGARSPIRPRQHSIQLGGRESTEPGQFGKKSTSGANPAILGWRHEGFVIAVR